VEDKKGQMIADETALKKALSLDALAVGMGMGNTPETYEVIKYLLLNYTGKLLIDADGLNALSTFGRDILKQKKCQVVLTPHVKEFSRLSNMKIDAIMCDIIENCKQFASDFGCDLVI
jgi:NAD(P)H-hydrate epimerase